MPRPRKAEATIKRSYYLGEKLVAEFERATLGNVSDGANGAFMIWLAFMDLLQVREFSIGAARRDDLDGAVRDVRKVLYDAILGKQLADAIADLTPSQKLEALAKTKEHVKHRRAS